MTIETILSGLSVPQALQLKREHIADNRLLRARRRCVTCDERWYRCFGLVRVGCRARRATEQTLSRYRPQPETFAASVTPTVPPWPVSPDKAPEAPPMRAEPRTGPASRPWTGDGDTIDTAVTVKLSAAFGGYRRGPHARPAALDTTAEFPVVVPV